ncbi:MAG: type II toxin-antitoxin system HicB family antitoxin [Candidatus Omnitrophica bacterium]|nr:type II toxin-antitoxin system HicB family antitoxin [Candidatus Omnitrophota bacterium]MCA9415462.1 type II toxin-antitoxin system HicB family antitoxin [Candidatus Omnitrophota bacterium]MCA9424605.1 type II toxin-antitoxin system HicB family antitoxin [Candidatus Omnitrophota bacterium]MCA9434561.1 type II toxin-antitoxin system HicB family antitoxin [Candidatus Omnitrophota bacterium]MCA9447821.1 type II toxin-antitoxin system HicB family antitoxin [Candidatus Omnitrophota bacterium]
MNMMKYKGYLARIEFDDEDRIFVGHLAGIKDIVGFHGSTVDELEKAFHESVDNYLEISERTGRPAETPYSGRLILDVSPDIHAALAIAAHIHGKSLNQWASEVLDKAVQAS